MTNDTYITTLQGFIERYSRAAEGVNETLEGEKAECARMKASVEEWEKRGRVAKKEEVGRIRRETRDVDIVRMRI